MDFPHILVAPTAAMSEDNLHNILIWPWERKEGGGGGAICEGLGFEFPWESLVSID